MDSFKTFISLFALVKPLAHRKFNRRLLKRTGLSHRQAAKVSLNIG